MSFIYDLAVTGRDWRRRRIQITSFSQFTTHLFFVVKYGGDPRGTLFQIYSNGRPCSSPCPLASRLLCFKGIQFLLVMSHLPSRNLSPGVPVSRPRRALSEPAPRIAKRTRPAATSIWTVHVVLRLARRIAITACTFCAHTLAGHPCHFAAQHLPCARPPDDHFRYSFIVALNFIACC